MDNANPKILVVDDEPSVLLTMSSVLSQEGYQVDAVASGAAAVQAVRERHYDLVLTDLAMPGVDGLAVLAEVRKRSPSTVTMMITGYGSLNSALEALQLGAYDYLLKPVEVPELKMAVQRSLERKRLSEVETLYRISRALATEHDLAAIVREVADAVRRVLGVANACVVTLGREGVAGDCDPALADLLRHPEVVAALQSGAVLTSDSAGHAAAHWAQAASVQSYALVPGASSGHLSCVLVVDNGQRPYEFHASAQRFLRVLADQTALAVENALLVGELRRNNQELAAANQKLCELDRLKSQFLSVATHELRTPLSIILGYNTMLLESLGPRLNQEEQEILEESTSACKRLIRLVNSMLDISQIEAGKMKMEFAPQDLRSLMSGVASLFRQEAARRGISLHLELPARLPRLQADGERMQQVFINLMGNALKFTGSGGSVTVAVRHRPERGAVQLVVRDTGVGIPPEDRDKIFEEFSRAPGGCSREGTGLGLAISRRIVEAHGGAIEVESAPGEGSAFTVWLPLKVRRGAATGAVSA